LNAGGVYYGQILDGTVRHGYGILFYTSTNGNAYLLECEWNQGTPKLGMRLDADDVYEGGFDHKIRAAGKGKYTSTSGQVYEGDFACGKLNGKGKRTWIDG